MRYGLIHHSIRVTAVVTAAFGWLTFITIPALAQDGATKEQSPDAINPVFVVMGGFTSCPSAAEPTLLPFGGADDIGTRVRDAAKQIETSIDLKGGRIQFFTSCYTNLKMQPNSILPVKPESFSLRWSPILTFEPKLGTPKDLPIAPVDVTDGSILNNLVKDLVVQIATLKNPRVYLFGHSYGGWSVMQLALKLQAAGIGIRGLVTMDPISPVVCKPDYVISAIRTFGVVTKHDCMRAPPDVTRDQRLAIGTSTDFWLHFYQLRFRPLHSTEIPEIAEMNSDADTRGANYNVNAKHSKDGVEHSTIVTSDRIWQHTIAGSIVNRFR